MNKPSDVPQTVDAYIDTCEPEIQPLMRQMRKTIQAAAPEATEKISWGMPTYVLHGNLVHFSAQKQHMGFHPDPSAIVAFEKELQGFSCSKGTVRLPYDRPLPLELIEKMVRFRVKEQKALAKAKAEAKERKK